MRRPALRSKDVPFGFDVDFPPTQLGNLLAYRSFHMAYVGAQNRAPCLLETPWSSLMRHLPGWKIIASLPCSQFVRCDSCRFGSPHQKGFRFMSVHCDLEPINKRCICKKKHLQVQGVYTKGSAVYTEMLAESIASCIASGLSRNCRCLESEHGLEVKGLESQLVYDLAASCEWKEESSWTFRKSSHINILEMASLLRLVQKLSDSAKPTRAVALVDSHVTKGASSKGRTASIGLGAVLRRVNAHMIASSIFLFLPFCPTRLNPSDDPTRDKKVRDPIPGVNLDQWDDAQLFDLIALPKTRRWASNWVRLVLKMLGPQVIYLHRRDLFRQTHKNEDLFDSPYVEGTSHHTLSFDATLGFPGEGWLMLFVLGFFRFGLCSLWNSLSCRGVLLSLCLVRLCPSSPSVVPLAVADVLAALLGRLNRHGHACISCNKGRTAEI